MLTKLEETQLRHFAARIRIETLKEYHAVGSGHVGGSMSVVETLAVLYGKAMNINANDPQWHDRDRYVMSKGHAGPALYAALALKGYFPMEWLSTLNHNGTRLPSHCDMKKTPGVDVTTGSLGQGISMAVGIVMGQQMDGKGACTYLMLGDGELNEGTMWEAAAAIHHYKLGNLVGFVDCNHLSFDGPTNEVLYMGNLADKFRLCGWYAIELDGHDMNAIVDAIDNLPPPDSKIPVVIVADTIKGKGIGFMENQAGWHLGQVDPETCKEAEKELIAAFETKWGGK